LNLWMGQKGGITPLHQDFGFADVLNLQLSGRKHWFAFDPSTKFNIAKNGIPEKFYSIDHQPGEIVFLPANWSHRVKLLDNCIALSMQTLDEKNVREHLQAKFQELFPMALNGDAIKKKEPLLYQNSYMRNQGLAKMLKIDLNKLR
jgi:ribosomal protein L16 Arg81 hydroxylase